VSPSRRVRRRLQRDREARERQRWQDSDDPVGDWSGISSENRAGQREGWGWDWSDDGGWPSRAEAVRQTRRERAPLWWRVWRWWR
jgi:hypothetical protein